jgi:hypothetical protein
MAIGRADSVDITVSGDSQTLVCAILVRETANAGKFPFNILFHNLSSKAITKRNTVGVLFWTNRLMTSITVVIINTELSHAV